MSDSMPPAPPTNDAYSAPGTTAGRFNVLAIVSFILGIVGFFVSIFGVVSLVALILGIVSRNQAGKAGQRGRGLALAAIILGAVGVVFTIIGLIVGLNHGLLG
jgi:hypothetical protein